MGIRVILADDHAVVREGIKELINKFADDIEVVGEASNGKEVLKMAENNPADIYILDISMPILNGIETTERLIRMDPRSKVIILSMHDNTSMIEKSLRYGAKGYILKESGIDEIIFAVREVYKNRFFISSMISNYIVKGFLGETFRKRGDLSSSLTRREREILQLIGEGFGYKEIANELNISVNTVYVHKNNIMAKLNIHKKAALIRYALREGISKP